MYKKKYNRHNVTLWTTDFFNSVFCLVSCSSKNQVPYLKAVTDSNLTRLLLRKQNKTKTKQNKTKKQTKLKQKQKQNKKQNKKTKKLNKQNHLGQVFQSVTSFET